MLITITCEPESSCIFILCSIWIIMIIMNYHNFLRYFKSKIKKEKNSLTKSIFKKVKTLSKSIASWNLNSRIGYHVLTNQIFLIFFFFFTICNLKNIFSFLLALFLDFFFFFLVCSYHLVFFFFFPCMQLSELLSW